MPWLCMHANRREPNMRTETWTGLHMDRKKKPTRTETWTGLHMDSDKDRGENEDRDMDGV